MTDKSEHRIIVLQNVTLKTNPVKNILVEKTCNRNSPTAEKDNSNMRDLMKRRRTASSYIFDEEPIFSDSEEEKEYCKNVLASQKRLDVRNESPKKLDVEVQCNLSSDNLKIVDVIQKCARINNDDVNEDFKRLIDICKELQFKYNVTQTTSENKSFGNVFANNQTVEKATLNNQNIVCQNLQNMHKLKPISTSEDPLFQEKFLPSRNGDSNADSDGFSSYKFSFDSGIANISFIAKSVDSNEEKENVRKSKRIRKPVNIFSPGKFITGKERQNILKKNRVRVKTKNIKAKQKKISKAFSRNNGANIAKHRKLAKEIDNFQLDINKHINIIKQRKTSSAKSTKLKRSAVLNDTYDNFMYIKAVHLPKDEIKRLARNWMKPHKRDEKNEKLPGDDKSDLLGHKPKLRRLFSPNAWLHSEELADLYIK